MVYKRVQKNSSSSSQPFKKGSNKKTDWKNNWESPFTESSFGIQPQADTDSTLHQGTNDYRSTNRLSRIPGNIQRQALTESQPSEKAEEVANESVEIQRQSESSESGDEDSNSTNGGTIQRFGADSKSELQAEPSELERSPTVSYSPTPQAGTIQRQNTPAAPKLDQTAPIQTKLTIGAPDDKYEQEADSMAEQVMSMDIPTANSQTIQRQTAETDENIQRQPLAASITPLIQRFTQTVQTKGGASRATPDLESRLTNQKGGGTPLDKETRSFMEPRFGSDLSQVRVHTDSTAVQMNKELGAQAFTHGNDIFYGAGKSPGQNALTAHELTHTIQQTGGVQLRRQPEKDNKQPRLSQKYPHTIQNKLTTGIQPRIQRKTDPGQILEQLKNTPPSNAATAYDTAQTNSATAWSEQKQELEASIPQIPAPTGLPAKDSGVKQTPQTASKADTNKEPLLPGGQKEPVAPKPPTQSDASVQIAPPRPITPTHIAGGNTAKTGETADAKPDPQIAASAQNALNSVNLDSSQISTKAGTAPTVDLADAAINPAQLDSEQQQANQQVQQEKAKSAQEINKDFGENDIFPKSSDETLKANKQLTLAQVAGAKGEKAPTIPPEIVANLDQSLAPQFQERIGGEQEKYTVGKNKFDQDTAKSRTDADKEIEKLNQDTSQQQLESQKQAQSDVQAARLEWQTELDNADKDYLEKAGKATADQKGKIDAEKLKGDAEASKHLADAEKEAEQKKQAAETEAQQKKDEGQKESGGFLGWLADKATAFIDGIKQAVNFIFDKLREGIKFIFEAAKKLALAAIELAQKAITTLIQAFGEILKGIVNLVFAAFPEIAKRINSKIDQAVNTAVQAVNTAADLLKKGVAAALDFLANTLDSLLGIIQSLYNAVLDAIGAIIKDAIEIMQRMGNLVEAAKQMPNHFMGQLSEEVLGMDLSQPLAFERSAEACAQCNLPAMPQGNNTTATAETVTGGDISTLLQKNEFTENDFTLDQVAPFDVSPEFLASLKLQDGGEVEFGESNDPANSMEAIKAELGGGELEAGQAQNNAAPGEQAVGGCCDDEQATEAKLQELMNQKPEGAQGTQKQGEPAKQGDIPENMKTVGPLTAGQRARYMANQMIQGVKQWFSANWPALLAGAIAALAAFIGLNILTGGAIMAAVPPLLQVVGTVMTGVALANIAGHIGSYLSQGWAGAIPGAAKSLARGLAAGAVELVFALLFNVGAVIKALKGGIKGTTKAVVNSVKNTVKTTLKSVKQLGQIAKTGAKTALKNGKIMLQGVKGGFAKGAKSLDDLARQLVGKLRFKKFSIKKSGKRIQLWGHINPKILLADNTIVDEVVDEGSQGAKFGDTVTSASGKKGILLSDDAITSTAHLPNPPVPTTRSLKDIKKLRGEKRWKAGEQFVNELYQGNTRRTRFPLQGTGGRYVDVVPTKTGQTSFKIEVKTYKQWTTVDGVPKLKTVPLSGDIQSQILKDVYLQAADPQNYKPKWIFTDAAPSDELARTLQDFGIPYTSYTDIR